MKWPACWLAAWLLSEAQAFEANRKAFLGGYRLQETEQKSKYRDDHASAIEARLQVWASTWEAHEFEGFADSFMTFAKTASRNLRLAAVPF